MCKVYEGAKRVVCMQKQSIHGGQGAMKWDYIAKSVREERRKGKWYNKETFDQEGSRQHCMEVISY